MSEPHTTSCNRREIVLHMKHYQLIVVGGGAAGLMAAGQAAAQGADVLLLEKMNRLGLKLRITGKGRCNLTNIAPVSDFIDHFGPNGRFLRQAFAQFFTNDLTSFFENLGVATIVERGGRVFPASESAHDIADALLQWAHTCGVKIETGLRVTRLLTDQGRVIGIEASASPRHRGGMSPGEEANIHTYRADHVIIATGGASYPATGSTGDGYWLAQSAGHTITPVRPALVPLETAGDVAGKLQGLSLRNVSVALILNGKKKRQDMGEMLFTHFGVSGPLILSLSRQAVDALGMHSHVELSFDLKPALDDQKLDARILRDLNAHGKQKFGTFLKGLLPRKLIPVCVELAEIPAEKVANQITGMERRRLRQWLKDFRLEVSGYRPFTEAIITAGGVNTREVDPSTMASRRVKGLFFAGEILDIEADTGGYNLQAAFSTGYVAGRHAAQ
jgi:predicted Rossmann fold flavoprotein